MKKIAASTIAQHIAQYTYDDLINNQSSNFFEELINNRISLDKKQKQVLNIWLLAHAINPALDLFDEKTSLIIRGETVLLYSELAGLDSGYLIDKITDYSNYYSKNYSKSPFTDSYWLLDEMGLNSNDYRQDPYLLTALTAYPLDPYTSILKSIYADNYKIVSK